MSRRTHGLTSASSVELEARVTSDAIHWTKARDVANNRDLQNPPAPTPALARRLLAGHAALVYLFLYAPILVLVILSFNRGPHVWRWEGFGLRWYAALLRDRATRDAAVNSLIVAGVATGASTVLGTLAALALARFRFRGQTSTRALLFLPIIVPEIVLGVALLTAFSLARVRLSLTTVVLAHVVFTVSYVAIVVRARLAGLDRSLEEAARDLGAGAVGAFVRVTLPLLLPGVSAAALLAFTLSLDDYVVTSLVSGTEGTLPLRVYSMVRKEVTPVVNAVSTALLLATVILIICAQRLLRTDRTAPSAPSAPIEGDKR